MALCDKGYTCDRCGEYVENMRTSELYLRHLMGAVPKEELLHEPERHIACCPELAQFIVDPAFPPVVCPDPALAKGNLPAEVRESHERTFTQAWRKLQALADERSVPDAS